jgi:hypothetical protein
MAGGLLLANFPAAAFYADSAIEILSRYTVRVHNDSNRPIESLVVTGPSVRVEMGPVSPSQYAVRHLQVRGDGRLDFSARQQELQFGGQLEGYVTHGSPGETIIRVRRRGSYEIQSADAGSARL